MVDSHPTRRMIRLARQAVESAPFRAATLAAIGLAGVLAGLETSAAVVARHGDLLRGLDAAVLAFFVVEIALKIAAHGRRPLDFFRDGWNLFDFVIVLLCLLPVGGPFAAVLRLVRVLRVLRLVSALPKLQLLVGALIRSFSSIGYVGLLLALVFYIYAVAGVHLFGKVLPEHFGTLRSALLALFQMITLDDWRNLYEGARTASPFAATLYFVTFILLGTMIMLNLFIGIVMNSMSEMHVELRVEKQAGGGNGGLDGAYDALAALDEQLAVLRTRLDAIRAGQTPSPR